MKLEPRDKKYLNFLILFMGLTALFDQYFALIEGPLMPYILEDFSLTAAEFALWQGIFGLITFSVFLIGWYSDAFGRKKGILLLILVMGIPAILILTAYNFFYFMLLYSLVIMGTLSNLWEIPIAEESPAAKRGRYGTLTYMIGCIPLVVLGGTIAGTLGWRWGYAIMMFLMVVLIVLWSKMKETQRWELIHTQRQSRVLKFKEALKMIEKKDLTYIVMCSIIYFLWSVSFKISSTFGGLYFVNIHGYTLAQYNMILLVGMLCMMLGVFISGFFMDKLGRHGTLIISCIGSTAGYIGLALTGSVLFYWSVFIFMPMLLGWIMVYFAEIFPTKIRSTAVGISATTARLAYVVGPLISFVLLTLDTSYMTLWLAAGLFMIIPLLTLLLKPYETKGKALEAVQQER